MRKTTLFVCYYGALCLAVLACMQHVAVDAAAAVGTFNATQTRKFNLGSQTGQVFTAFSGGGQIAAFGLPRKNQVRVYTRLSSDWLTEPVFHTLVPDTAGALKFGKAVELDGSDVLMAVSAPGYASSAGAVYLFFQNSSSLFQQRQRLEELGGVAGNEFGSSLAMSSDGQRIFVSLKPGVGGFYTFIRDPFDNDYKTQGGRTTVTTTPALQGLNAGSAIVCSSDGEVVAYSAAGANSNQGAVWIFRRNETEVTYDQKQEIKVASTQFFGSELSMSDNGNVLAIASSRANGANAYVYQLNTQTNLYELLQAINTPQVGGDVSANSSVTVSGTGWRVLVGDRAYGANAGGLFAFVRLDDVSQFTLYSSQPVQGTTPSTQQGASSDLDSSGDALLFADGDYNSGSAWVFEAITDTGAPTFAPGTTPPPNNASPAALGAAFSALFVAILGMLAVAV